ncbi:hypothetical protein B9Z19DRAFT_1068901 [Tuber borchii]|uniref:Uncharacterized protein n=1 Tax=Tuber borchii TaxID=42251 RepID=A0A2T6ZDQ2_TUBBO|nr:hypothetical protein B9Z19DRAFT_1068901 [Tuber borchii]
MHHTQFSKHHGRGDESTSSNETQVFATGTCRAQILSLRTILQVPVYPFYQERYGILLATATARQHPVHTGGLSSVDFKGPIDRGMLCTQAGDPRIMNPSATIKNGGEESNATAKHDAAAKTRIIEVITLAGTPPWNTACAQYRTRALERELQRPGGIVNDGTRVRITVFKVQYSSAGTARVPHPRGQYSSTRVHTGNSNQQSGEREPDSLPTFCFLHETTRKNEGYQPNAKKDGGCSEALDPQICDCTFLFARFWVVCWSQPSAGLPFAPSLSQLNGNDDQIPGHTVTLMQYRTLP